MKIHFENGSIDTEKLPDKDAELLECLGKLEEISIKYDCPFVITILNKGTAKVTPISTLCYGDTNSISSKIEERTEKQNDILNTKFFALLDAFTEFFKSRYNLKVIFQNEQS